MELTWRNRRMAAVLAVFLAVILGAGRPAAVLATEAKEPVSTKAEVEEPGEKDPKDPTTLAEEPTTKEPEEGEGATTGTEEETTVPVEEPTTSAEAEGDKETEKLPGEETSKQEEESSDIEETTKNQSTEETSEGEESRNPETETETQETSSEKETETEQPDSKSPFDVTVYDYEIINVVVPVAYAAALNPYKLEVDMGDGVSSTDQVLSRNYGIINKSSKDVIVTVTITVQDENGGKIKFVDSPDKVRDAGMENYAVYLAFIPSDSGRAGARVYGIDKNTESTDLSDVAMVRAENRAVALCAGKNQVKFRLSRAVYAMKEGTYSAPGRMISGGDAGQMIEFRDIAEDGTGVAAFTFGGVMNEEADWTALSKGVRISMVYSYEAVDGGGAGTEAGEVFLSGDDLQ